MPKQHVFVFWEKELQVVLDWLSNMPWRIAHPVIMLIETQLKTEQSNWQIKPMSEEEFKKKVEEGLANKK